MKILVTGATGNVGGQVANQLIAAGHRPKLMVRNAEKARARFGDGADLVLGDLSQPESLAAAFAGADRLFLVSAGVDLATQDGGAVAAARAAGVGHIVKLSTLGTAQGDSPGGAISRWHRMGEEAIEASGLGWTHLRPGSFMSNTLMWIPTIRALGKVFAPTGEGRFAPIHPADIGAVGVTALTEAGHEGKIYELTGPEALTNGELVAEIAAALGRPLEFVDIPESVARENMGRSGMPPALIDGILALMAMIRTGKGAKVTDTVATVTGRAPRTFRSWVAENVAAFR